MVDHQLNSFASEVTRWREKVRKGSWASRRKSEAAGTWKDLTDNVNSMAGNLTAQVRNIAEVTAANGDLEEDHRRCQRRDFGSEDTINVMVDQPQLVCPEVTRWRARWGQKESWAVRHRFAKSAGTWILLGRSTRWRVTLPRCEVSRGL